MIKQFSDEPTTTFETDGERPCACGFSAEECAQNLCLRKKEHLAGLTPGSKWPEGASVSANPPRACTCHPDDNPPQPCPQRFAYSECVEAARIPTPAQSSAGSVELKPCPFCGGAMVEVTDEDGHYFVHPGRMGMERADCWLADAWVSDEPSGEGSIGEWNMRAGPTEPLQCLRCGTIDAFGPVSKERQTNINKCPSCKRMFKDGETCSRGGCPMGGDL